MDRIRDTYGPGSRYVNYATGVSALLRPAQLAKRLLSLDGGYLDYYNSYSTACIRHATKLMYGTYETGNDRADGLNSKLLILWSHNPAETVFDGDSMFYLRKAKEQGIPIIVVDPRYSDTAREFDAEWIPLRPATDSALLDAMAYVIVSEGLQDQGFLDRYCLGFDKEHMPEGVDPSLVLSFLADGRAGRGGEDPRVGGSHHRRGGGDDPQPGPPLCPGPPCGADPGLWGPAPRLRRAERKRSHPPAPVLPAMWGSPAAGPVAWPSAPAIRIPGSPCRKIPTP